MHIFELLVGIILFSFAIVSIVTLINVTKEDDKEYKDENDE